MLYWAGEVDADDRKARELLRQLEAGTISQKMFLYKMRLIRGLDYREC